MPGDARYSLTAFLGFLSAPIYLCICLIHVSQLINSQLSLSLDFFFSSFSFSIIRKMTCPTQDHEVLNSNHDHEHTRNPHQLLGRREHKTMVTAGEGEEQSVPRANMSQKPVLSCAVQPQMRRITIHKNSRREMEEKQHESRNYTQQLL